ncbi:hypothetical protein Tco_0822005 [Tanacetum coccineum]|uniref:Uncharacterized protein n=1 Tax=Tanacetum coccineum TaxID=301880 RepID=A0ABQ5AEX1_9ASTR
MSCLPDDIMEFVISCVSAKETWTDLVHSFEGPLDTKENRIMDLKLKYQTFRAKSTESLSQTYTRYKTLLNELANDGVNLSKHEINVGFMNSLPEKWLTFSQGPRNTNHRANASKSTESLSQTYTRYKTLLNELSNDGDNLSKHEINVGFVNSLPEKWLTFSQSSSNLNNQADPKFQKDYKAEYKKMKAKLALLEASLLSSQNPKNFQPKNKGLVAKTFDWDEEEVFDEEEVTQVKVLIALADDELIVGKSHARNKQLKKEKKINEKWLTSSKKVRQCISEQIPHQKKKDLGGELLTEYDQEMVPKTKDWAERLNPDSKLLNFNTGRILVPESQFINESLETLNTPESSKDFEA